MNIFIYRPDKAPNQNVTPDLCYTPSGQNFIDWQREQQEVLTYKIELAKSKQNAIPEHKIFDYWR